MFPSMNTGRRPGARPLLGVMAIAAATFATTLAQAGEPSSGPAAPPATSASASASAAVEPAPASTTAPAAAAIPDPLLRPHRAHKEGTPPTAFNPKANAVRWDPSWPKFRTPEYVVTGVLGVAVFAGFAIPTSPNNWRDMNDFDAGARDAIRLKAAGDRSTANDASDLILALMVNQLVVDATLVAWWGHDRPSVAYQMVLMDMEALAISGGVQAIVSGITSRQRPYRDKCLTAEAALDAECTSNKQYRSFFSGHTAGAFTVAGLMCMHHAYLPLYGGGLREKLTCAASFAAAASVGLLRIASDNHFMSDVLVGAGVGTLVGLGVPWLLHYRGGAQVDTTGRTRGETQVSFRLTPMPTGIGASGEF